MTLRRTGIVRRSALVRTGRLVRQAMRRTPSKPQQQQQKARKSAYTLVDERSGGQCEAVAWQTGRCARAATLHHHRRLRGQGGSTDPVTESASNILGLCDACHTNIHRFPDASKAIGLIVLPGHSPAATPVALCYGSVFLDNLGNYREASR